ncbi:MAG TPA: recombination protein O N-terminal domain-containing protein [Victivallales bacterium]|nr:recombination protein O N-terminal domain-containing protein [Victivallales bacterium]
MHKTVLTEVIILRKIPYSETSLIINSLSPEYGRLDFIIKGARRISKKSFPEIDIFRKLKIEFKEIAMSKNLISPLSFDLIEDNDRIAGYPEAISRIYKIISFILKNIHAGVSCRFVYDAFDNMLCKTSEGKEYPFFLIKLIYLYENGLLPNELSVSDKDNKNKKILNLLINSAIGKIDTLKLPDEYVQSLNKWVNNLCLANDLE